jgi:hypothetical protein
MRSIIMGGLELIGTALAVLVVILATWRYIAVRA